MKKIILLALVLSPVFAQADTTCQAMQTGEFISIPTADTEGAPLTGSIKITRLSQELMDVPVAQVASYKNTEDELFIEALDAEMKNTILKINAKKDAGAPFPAPREGVYWGVLNRAGTTMGLRCELKK